MGTRNIDGLGSQKIPDSPTRTPSKLLENAVYGKGTRWLQPLDEPVPVYDVEKMSGLPVGVQIVGRPWEDEKVVHVMEILDRELGERGFGPGLEAQLQTNNYLRPANNNQQPEINNHRHAGYNMTDQNE